MLHFYAAAENQYLILSQHISYLIHTFTSLNALSFKLKVIKQYLKLSLVKDADTIETFPVHFVTVIDSFLTTSG